MSEEQNKINLENIAGSLSEDVKNKQKIENDEEIPNETGKSEAEEVKVDESGKEEELKDKKPESSLPAEPEDIFYETEREKPAVLQAKTPQAEDDYQSVSTGISKKIVILVIVLLILVALVVGVYFSYNHFFSTKTETGNDVPVSGETVPVDNVVENNDNNDNSANVNQLVNNLDVEESSSSPEPVDIESQNRFEEEIDTDGDGVLDKDEIVRGMNIESNDSDSDGLYDREEVMVYNTDPTNPDTDGDGFSDGDEVNAGYNPKGAGKLYDLTEAN